MSNDFTGPDWYLDTVDNNTREAFMSDGNHAGQYLILDVVDQNIVTSTAPAKSSGAASRTSASTSSTTVS